MATFGKGKYSYTLVENWAKLPVGHTFMDVCKIHIDSLDRIYMLTRGTHPVVIYDRAGNVLKEWDETVFGRPHGLFIGPDGSVYTADVDEHTVSKYSPEGKLLLRLGNRNQPSDSGYLFERGRTPDNIVRRGAPPFNRPTNVTLSPSGEIYVTDGYGNARVHKFSADGKLLLSWGEPGNAPGQFQTPHSVWVDRQERVWICDRQNDRIQIFDNQGKFLNMWTDLIKPADLFIDADEKVVYVSELSPPRISIFDINGALLARYAEQETDKQRAVLVAPHSIALDSQGDLYVGEVAKNFGQVDRGGRAVQKFALNR